MNYVIVSITILNVAELIIYGKILIDFDNQVTLTSRTYLNHIAGYFWPAQSQKHKLEKVVKYVQIRGRRSGVSIVSFEHILHLFVE